MSRDKVCSTLKSKKGDFISAGREMEVSEFGVKELIFDCAKQIDKFADDNNYKQITSILNRSIANLAERLKGNVASNSGSRYNQTILINEIVTILGDRNTNLLLEQSKLSLGKVENNINSNLHGFIMFFVFFMFLLNYFNFYLYFFCLCSNFFFWSIS